MGSRERLILILLSLALAGGLVALVVIKGREREGASNPPIGSIGPPGWDLRRVPSFGHPIRTQELTEGLFVQTVEEGQGEPIPADRPTDIQFRVLTLDGVQHGRGIYPRVTRSAETGAGRSLPAPLLEGLVGVKMFEKRRLLIPHDRVQAGTIRNVPGDRRIIMDLQPVELVIEDLVQGTGPVAALNQHIYVHYEGKLEDGTIFDSSHRRGRPADFKLKEGGLIRGWTEGIPGMRVGGKRRLWIPFHLAYGARSAGPAVPPYSNLIFEIELLEVR